MYQNLLFDISTNLQHASYSFATNDWLRILKTTFSANLKMISERESEKQKLLKLDVSDAKLAAGDIFLIHGSYSSRLFHSKSNRYSLSP